MKNFKVKWLLLSFILSVASINNAWGWGTISLNGNFTGNNWGKDSYNINYSLGDGGAHTFLPIYTSSGDKYWRLYHSGDGGNYTLSPASDNYVISYGTHYQVKGNGDKNFKTNVNAGIIAVHSSQVNTAYASGSYTEPAVWLERPTIYIWHNWSGNTANWGNNGGSGQKAMTDNNDGTYTYDGVYSASGTNVGIQGDAAIKKYFADNVTTKVGSPVSGNKCRFTWNPNGNSDPYVGYDAETKHRGSLTITKILTVTYNGNGKTSGSVPSNTDAVYDEASTLATSDLAKTNYHFNGWNTKADGTGKHFDAGGSIDTTTNVTLYAEWVDEWAIQGSGTEMGAWSDYNYLPITATANTFQGTITLAANTTYKFKIRNRNTGKLWGYGDNDYQLAFVGQSSAYGWDLEYTDGKKDLVLMTAKAGTYTFTWNSSTKRLTVGFPSQTHPNSNNIYFKNSGGSAYSSVNAHIWNGTASTGFYRLPTLPTCTFAGETYYYAAIGDNTKCLFADGEVNPGTKTADQTSVNEKRGKYYDLSSGTWKDFTVSVNLNNQSATTAGASSVTATYNAAMPSIASNKPAKTGYDFQGYYESIGGSGTKYYNADGTSAHVWDQTGASPQIYAYWTPVPLTLSTAGNWNVAGNWTRTDNGAAGCVPTIGHVVTINKPVVVNITDAKAQSVKIYNDGTNSHTGKLTISAGKKLVVAEDIQMTANGSDMIATTANVLQIESDGSSGVGALVWGDASTSPGEATVNFYSLSRGSKGSEASVNQFIGTPFTKETSDWLYNYYNSWVLGVNYAESSPAFYLLGSDDQMEPFKGYCVIYNGSAGHTYNMSGTLVTNEDHTCSSLSYKSGDAGNIANENLLANPWLAPIKINAMQVGDFTKAAATIYIFNSTSSSASKDGLGNYSTYPIASAGSNVIPAMQSFSVFTTGSGGSVALDYSKIVYDPAVAGTLPVANKAPKRVAEDEANKLRLYVNAESGYGDMIYMWERSDFNEGFENGWDGHKITGDKEAPQFYAITPDGNMAVNCVPNFEGTVMGFKAGTEDSEYTFTFDYEGEQVWYLNDLEAQQSTLINAETSYNFSAVPGTVAEHRFVISHSPIAYVPTGIDNSETVEDVKARKLMINGMLYIIRGGRIYSTDGQMVK